MPSPHPSVIGGLLLVTFLASTAWAQDTAVEKSALSSDQPEEAWLTDKSIPADIADIERKLLHLGAIQQDFLDYRNWNKETFPPDQIPYEVSDAFLTEKLFHHLYPRPPLWEQQRKHGTGHYAYEQDTENFLGEERAKWCEPTDKHCIPPKTVSILCDITRVITCRTLARAVRMSEKLFLLYPYVTTPEQQRTDPDVTLIYTMFPGEQDYGVYAIDNVTNNEYQIVLEKKEKNKMEQHQLQ